MSPASCKGYTTWLKLSQLGATWFHHFWVVASYREWRIFIIDSLNRLTNRFFLFIYKQYIPLFSFLSSHSLSFSFFIHDVWKRHGNTAFSSKITFYASGTRIYKVRMKWDYYNAPCIDNVYSNNEAESKRTFDFKRYIYFILYNARY